MTEPAADAQTDLLLREPQAHELARVTHLFRNVRLRRDCRLLVAERRQPIARFVAAGAWWIEGTMSRFRLASQPQTPPRVLAALIEAVVAAGREAGLETAQYAELLPDESPWSEILERAEFERLRSERFFEVGYAELWQRTMPLHEKLRKEIPSTWRTDPIREHGPETILDLDGPHRLLPPEDLLHYWQETTAAGFDLDLSCILFDEERAFGTLLLRRLPDGLFADAQIVAEPNRLRRSLGDLCLLHHVGTRVPPGGPVRWIRFRSGELEHRQTANLALRSGGRELPRRHVFGRSLGG